ncbi:MAG TPA: TonB-dependent receptor [Candidatus Acidoferrales bacterium]|nr:TonB-dependent receptor [Candidatus Acidoferrales bacterium]
MRSKLFAGVFVFLVCLLFSNLPAYGQGVGASGAISGTVTDPQGGVLPKASVVAVEIAQGTQYSAIADDTGGYRLTGLLPGTYKVTVRMDRFETQAMNGVVVNVGETVVLDVHLKLATTAQTVEVTAIPPVVETERGSQANTITQQYIEDLPIDRRDYLTFTLLLPGVSDSTRLADDQDFRVKQTPQSGLSFYGSNGRGNSITVDGGEAQDDAGGVRPTIGQDAVQEFQVNRSNYAADLGGANGASINIVSKSGTNNIHGSLFGYFRNDALDARDPFAFSPALTVADPFSLTAVGAPVKDSLQRYQFGGSVGAPIKKDKTFVFFAFEGLRQDAQNAVPLLTNSSVFGPTFDQQQTLATLAANPAPTVPCLSGPIGVAVAPLIGQPPPTGPNGSIPNMVAPATCAAGLGAVLTVSPATPIGAFLVNQFETQGGLFPYNSRDYLASARLDHHIDANNQIFLSYRYAHDLEQNPDVQSLTAFSAGSSVHDYDNNIQGAWFHQFSPTTQNELRLQWDYNSFNVIPNEPGQVGLQIPGFINNLGTNIFLPNLTILRRYEIADNFTMIRGHHTIQFGINELLRGNHTESHTFLPGRFVFGPLNDNGTLLSPLLPSLSSLQTASFGLPLFYQQAFGNPDYPAYTRPLTGLYVQDSWKMASNFTLNYGLRYDIDSQYRPLNTYYRDFGPRVSFAWDPFKDHKTVVRGGYGIFFGPIDAQIPGVDLSLGVLNKNRSTVENNHNKSQVPDQVNNLIGTCGVDFPPGNPLVPGSGTSPCTRFISIYADALGQTALFPTLQTSGQIFQGLFNPLGNPSGTNLIACTQPAPGANACITPADVAPFGIFVQNGGATPAQQAISPTNVVFSNPPNYRPPMSQQASLGIEREITPGFSIGVSGIYSHTTHLPVAIDTNLLPTTPTSTVTLANGSTTTYKNWNLSAATDPLGGVEGLPCAPPNNPLNCFVSTLVVQNNQYTSVASSLYEGLILEARKRFSNHFTLFGNYTFSKGFDTSTDFNTDYSPQDPTDLGLDRALSEFDERHKVVVAGVFDSPWKGFLSGFQLSPIFTYHSGLPFNLLAGGEVNGDNHTTNQRPIGSPRDTGLGPNFYDWDMRLSWQHKLGERVNMILTAEGFNIANRTNFASVNNEVNPLFGINTTGAVCPIAGRCSTGNTSFNVHGLRSGTVLPSGEVVTPSTPLAFTSAFPKRQVQLGIRFAF